MIDRQWSYCNRCGRTFERAWINKAAGQVYWGRQSGCPTADECEKRVWRDYDFGLEQKQQAKIAAGK